MSLFYKNILQKQKVVLLKNLDENLNISDQCDNISFIVKMKSRLPFKTRIDKVSKPIGPIRSMQVQLFKSQLKYQTTQIPNTKNPIQKLIQSIRAESGSEQVSENLFNKHRQAVL